MVGALWPSAVVTASTPRWQPQDWVKTGIVAALRQIGGHKVLGLVAKL